MVLAFAQRGLRAQEQHDHGAPEKPGNVSFPISCSPSIQAEFNRGVALLHSFAYASANATFQQVAAKDPGCAMAHWGVAMSMFHQLWEPQLTPRALLTGQTEIATAQRIGSSDARERGYIRAFALLVKDADTVPFTIRDQQYEQAMADLAHQNKNDVEAQIFYALSLISNAPPTDKTHTRQKRALTILEPLDRAYPNHPGITHYIIHASDSIELAPQGLAAARKYAQVAPSVPHALHMPSHIFTRVGLWQDSVESNLAASNAAHEQNDLGEEVHAMDYLVYAYLQLGRFDDAHRVIDRLHGMESLDVGDFKAGYAATAMPVRYAVERHAWNEAAKIQPYVKSPPQVAAIAVWAHALGRTRGARTPKVDQDIAALELYEDQLKKSGSEYWASQVRILREEVLAWADQANGNTEKALTEMRQAADEEDAMEKLPVTPGPVVPAREQLGEFLLEQYRPADAVVAFKASLVNAPGRKGALDGLAQATQQISAR